ncbi:MAG: hypothetical protein ABSC94_31830 [Polyangiaceae bacterium]|jgi:hypothetical protein
MTALSHDDLVAIQLLARDALYAGEQASEARDVGAHHEADDLEAERRCAIAQMYKILGVEPP